MNIDIKIRPYRSDDIDCLLTIWRRASTVGHPFLTEQQLDEQAKLVREVYLPQAENWIAICNGLPIGFIGLLDHLIGGLFVDPDFHTRGVGRALIEHAAKLKGHMELEVYALNTRATAFYQRLGFHEVSRRDLDDSGWPFELVKLAR
jgi:ribosomal protein S18 acetylase RimI-like enzyme